DTTDYTPASGTVNVNVAKATPTVTVNPVTIIYGIPLDTTQLLSGFGLQLEPVMSWGNGSGVPTSGKNLVIVGIDSNNLLHIRIFDAVGNRIRDTDETKLPATQTEAAAIATLKQQLPGLLPPHTLTDAEKAQVIGEVTSIVG